jgi:hypothetical protein
MGSRLILGRGPPITLVQDGQSGSAAREVLTARSEVNRTIGGSAVCGAFVDR